MTALAALAASACLSAPVSYGTPPNIGAPTIPWIHAGPVIGYLFYYGAEGPWKRQTGRVIITTGGGPQGGYATKILWHVRGGSKRITVVGTRLDGAGRFTQRFSASGAFYPSIVVVPSSGCWRLTVTSARHVGRFAVVALDA
ncbi:MAG TPA: hypothetical protein VMU39_26190 [Solirubrobacteraceae bacterium]|nr:hypothetical protein [Solirubrobacteraceae bacterium]